MISFAAAIIAAAGGATAAAVSPLNVVRRSS
jgi:hypothetical protein